jgi:hypothetical protein
MRWIVLVDDLGTLHVRWDNGIRLGLTLRDEFDLLPGNNADDGA